MGFMDMIKGAIGQRELKKLDKWVNEIEALEPQMQALNDEALKAKTLEFKERYEKGETLDDLLVEAFAVVREASVRVIGMRHYRVQLIGGIVLHQGRISEMRTGEGKTLMATLPSYLNALSGLGVHVVTVNDYLAKRDRDWMGKVYTFLGLTVGCIIHGVEGAARREQYNCDITYGTNNEFGFDYLRDNMVVFFHERSQRELNYAIIDEVDSILVDEARTPLIISGEGSKSTNLYNLADEFVKTLRNEADYTVDEKAKSVVLTDDSGVQKAERFFAITNLSEPENMEISHHINQGLKARILMKKDVDYVVKDDEILIVDEFTGRLMLGRRYSNGLHQAIEAKEGLEVRKESQTLATITLQNYFRQYKKLSGMTGTAKTEEDEFKHIYNMDVVEIPTNKPIIRKDMPDCVYNSVAGKFKAVVEQIEERHALGQPMLVGTISIETSEYLSKVLKRKGIKHEVLNAKQHDREAEIVAQAGRYASVTIATNMAGRGTDILLGGNPEFMAKQEMRKAGMTEEQLFYATSPLEMEEPEFKEGRLFYEKHYALAKAITDVEAERVKDVGGLHIMGTERHESRRIDNQLRGRAGRQGDPGSTQFFISLEDDLMRLFMSERVKEMIEKLGMDEDTPIEARILSKSIESAQKKVEGRNFGIRKHVLQYDDVLNKQREIIYAERSRVLEGDNLKDHIQQMIDALADEGIALYTGQSEFQEEWNIQGLIDHLNTLFLHDRHLNLPKMEELTREKLKEVILESVARHYAYLEREVTSERLREIERYILLKVVDNKWIDHIDAMESLKQGIGLRAIGQEDPVKAYQIEGFGMFNEMIQFIKEDTVRLILNATVRTETKREQVAKITNAGPAELKPSIRKDKKVGRNDPCPCGSGKKYKKCHGLSDEGE
jgi:preprotein translocase subunit SecA